MNKKFAKSPGAITNAIRENPGSTAIQIAERTGLHRVHVLRVLRNLESKLTIQIHPGTRQYAYYLKEEA